MKIATILASGGLNIGNNFINAGGEYIIKTLFPNETIYKFEYFDTSVKSGWQYLSDPLTESSKKFIEENCEVGFLFAGSMLSKVCENTLKYFRDMKIPIYVLGLSCHKYDDYEKQMASKISEWFKGIFTRDETTFNLINYDGCKNNLIINSIDLGFYAIDNCQIRKESGNYAVLNFDPAKANASQIYHRRDVLLNVQGYDNVYVVENSHFTPRFIDGYLQISYYDQLINLYANASYVETNRVHTALICAATGTEFSYVGSDTGRLGLFENAKIEIKPGIIVEKNKYVDHIKKLKEYQLKNFKRFIPEFKNCFFKNREIIKNESKIKNNINEKYTILIQGKLNNNNVYNYCNTYKNIPIIISTWEDSDFEIDQKNVTVIKSPIPPGRKRFQNFNLQCISTIIGLKEVTTEYVVKIRGDEFYSNIDNSFKYIEDDPTKIYTVPVYFRPFWKVKYHISDHFMIGKTKYLLSMFESARDENQKNERFSSEHALTKQYLLYRGFTNFDNIEEGKKIMKKYFDIMNLEQFKPYTVLANGVGFRWDNNFIPEKNASISKIEDL